MSLNQFKSTTGNSFFIQKHSAIIRIWHWLTFLFIFTSMVTVLLTSTILNQRKNIEVVQEQLKGKGVIITEDQAFAVSRQYEDKSWEVHKWTGYGLAFLLLSRVLIELALSGEEKLKTRLKNAVGLYKKNDDNKSEYRHYIGVKFGYLLFYILLFCMVFTGLGLAFGRDFGFSRELHNTIKEIHSLGQYLIYVFVFVHLCGVIISDNNRGRGLVSGMINGNK